MSLVQAEHLTKTYRSGDVEVPAIKGADFAIEPGSFVAFVGPSGSGKSTLLNLIGCLDHPTSGTLKVLDTDIATLDRRAAARFRGEHIGFVFQDFNLIPVLTVYENIEYVWAYERSTQEYLAIKQVLAEPDPLRLAWRDFIKQTIREVITNPGIDPFSSIQRSVAARVPEQEQSDVQALIVEELRRLHEGVLARYGLRPSEYTAWKALHGH